MFVIVRCGEGLKRLYYKNSWELIMSAQDIRRVYGEVQQPIEMPKLFETREEAEVHVNEWPSCVIEEFLESVFSE